MFLQFTGLEKHTFEPQFQENIDLYPVYNLLWCGNLADL